MSQERRPRVTVAAVVEQDGYFLFVEESIRGHLRLNQPAGHVEHGEGLVEAVCRETLEETGYEISVDALIGVYQWHAPRTDRFYVRFAFAGRALAHHEDAELDSGIIAPHWLSLTDLSDPPVPLRSPMVRRNVEDFLAGKRYQLDLITSLPQP